MRNVFHLYLCKEFNEQTIPRPATPYIYLFNIMIDACCSGSEAERGNRVFAPGVNVGVIQPPRCLLVTVTKQELLWRLRITRQQLADRIQCLHGLLLAFLCFVLCVAHHLLFISFRFNETLSHVSDRRFT